MKVLLDATTVIDLVDEHPSAPGIAALLPQSLVCAVNWLEVVTWAAARRGLDPHLWSPRLFAAGLEVIEFTAADAAAGPEVRRAEAVVRDGRPATAWRGLATADVACLATAVVRRLSVTTSDALMREVGGRLGLKVSDHRVA